MQNLSCEKDFYLHENKKLFWYPSSVKFKPATMDVTEFASFVTTALGPRQTSQPRNPEVLGLRTALVVNSVSFFAFILPDSTSPLFFLKKGPNVLDTFLHVLYNHSNYFLYFTKCYDNLELKSSIVKYSSQVMLWNFCLFGDHWK